MEPIPNRIPSSVGVSEDSDFVTKCPTGDACFLRVVVAVVVVTVRVHVDVDVDVDVPHTQCHTHTVSHSVTVVGRGERMKSF